MELLDELRSDTVPTGKELQHPHIAAIESVVCLFVNVQGRASDTEADHATAAARV